MGSALRVLSCTAGMIYELPVHRQLTILRVPATGRPLWVEGFDAPALFDAIARAPLGRPVPSGLFQARSCSRPSALQAGWLWRPLPPAPGLIPSAPRGPGPPLFHTRGLAGAIYIGEAPRPRRGP